MTKILIAGATGYVGGRLAPRLIEAGHDVRCLVRNPDRLRDVVWARHAEIVAGDVTDAASLESAMENVETVFYLVHSIGGREGFAAADRAAAEATSRAAGKAGVGRIVYLGGLVPQHGRASEHLASRAEVGQIFLDGAVPAVVLQAAVIIGSGSASFEMLRYLTERLPIMVVPRWVHSAVQPIAIHDVLGYLAGALTLPAATNRRFDIAGPDILTYGEMMQRYATVAGLRRRIIVPVPLLTPRLSSHWVNLVTPVPKAIAQPLIESLRNSVVASENDIRALLPGAPIGFDEAVRLALAQVKEADVETHWAGASWPGAPADPLPTDPDWAGGTVCRDERVATAHASASDVWTVIQGIGGTRGWYSSRLGWWTRGVADRLIGGVGLRRGRRHPDLLRVGEPLDFWRVEALEHGRLLRLRAEMRLPGHAWLEFVLEEKGAETVITQRATFRPRGLLGQAYWWLISPFHGRIFGRMLVGIARESERLGASATG